MWTQHKFLKLPHQRIFARGVVEQWFESGVSFTRDYQWRLMKWVAVKGIADDWTMYFGRDDENTYEEVAMHGDKFSDRKIIQGILNCNYTLMWKYRR